MKWPSDVQLHSCDMDQFGCLMAGWLAGCVWEQNRLLTFWSAITILIQKIFRSQSSHLDMCLLVSELLWTNYLCVNRFYRNKYSNEGGDAWKGLATRLRMQWRFCSLKEKAFYRNSSLIIYGFKMWLYLELDLLLPGKEAASKIISFPHTLISISWPRVQNTLSRLSLKDENRN